MRSRRDLIFFNLVFPGHKQGILDVFFLMNQMFKVFRHPFRKQGFAQSCITADQVPDHPGKDVAVCCRG